MSKAREKVLSVPRHELFDTWCNGESTNQNDLYALKKDRVLKLVQDKLGENWDLLSEEEVVKNCTKVDNVCKAFQRKWQKQSRMRSKFESAEKEWLNESYTFILPEPPINSDCTGPSQLKTGGRPSKEFADLSACSKRRRISSLVETSTAEELSYAASTSLYIAGKRDTARLVRDLSDSPPEKGTEVKKAFTDQKKGPIKYSPDEGLALMIDCRLSKASYDTIRAGAKVRNADIYPSYHQIRAAKELCYPPAESIHITETEAEVRLRDLVQHTVIRLTEALVDSVDFSDASELNLIFKWGGDGSSGYSGFKQKFGSESASDSSIFSIGLAPILLQNKCNGKIIWKNPRPNSVRFCRPIKLILAKETKEFVGAEMKKIEEQIKMLEPIKTTIEGNELTISSEFKLTMIDGKTFGVITNSSNQSCGICGATPKLMNNIDKLLKRKCKKEALENGLSPLHAYIRCMEYILHLGYRLKIKKWQMKTAREKAIGKKVKKKMQKKFRRKLGLLIDMPKQGSGTTNDGNSARTFFANPKKCSKITGVDEEIIRRFGVLLKALSCGYNINADTYDEYALETARKCVELYPWYYMPSAVHKMLIHGADIRASKTSLGTLIPIGSLSEEAIETKNKDLRRFREHNTRKTSRLATMTDLFHALLFASDPKITMISLSSATFAAKYWKLGREVRSLLIEPSLSEKPDNEEESSSSSEDTETESDEDSETDTEEGENQDDDEEEEDEDNDEVGEEGEEEQEMAEDEEEE